MRECKKGKLGIRVLEKHASSIVSFGVKILESDLPSKRHGNTAGSLAQDQNTTSQSVTKGWEI